jgi:hypothetical protein
MKAVIISDFLPHFADVATVCQRSGNYRGQTPAQLEICVTSRKRLMSALSSATLTPET